MSKLHITPELAQRITAAIANNAAIIAELTGTIEPSAALTVQVLEPVQVVARPNGLLTAASGKAIREALLGTPGAGFNIHGNTRATVAADFLTECDVPFVMVDADTSATEAMTSVRAAKETKAPKAKAPKAKAAKADKPKSQRILDRENGVTPEQRQALNSKLASDMRDHGVVPQGQAWAQYKAGERSWKTLRELNAADGVEFKGVGEVPSTKTVKTAIVAEIVPDAKAKAKALVATGLFTKAEAKAAVASALANAQA